MTDIPEDEPAAEDPEGGRPGRSGPAVAIESEMRTSYLDYAMSVIVSRAIPDLRDGLKPVHRRILYAMQETGNTHDKAYRKSARPVGDVMGKYHPHGDGAIYDALVRMAQPFSMSLPLLDGQGNFGSMDGDQPAAMRYTEVRLDKPADFLMADIDKDTVDFQPNYDGKDMEPSVLPARFPNMLVNGAGGIAVGMATNIPPHNLGEVIDATLALIDNPDLSVADLMEFVPAPDFPTGGIILGRSGARKAYHEGRGSVILRARTKIEEIRKDRFAIVATEIPYQVNKATLIERIAELARDRKIEGIAHVQDESDRFGVRVVVVTGGTRGLGRGNAAWRPLGRDTPRPGGQTGRAPRGHRKDHRPFRGQHAPGSRAACPHLPPPLNPRRFLRASRQGRLPASCSPSWWALPPASAMRCRSSASSRSWPDSSPSSGRRSAAPR